MKAMKIIILLALATSLFGCASYSGVTRISKKKVLILRNDGLLFGLMRKALVCDVSPQGVSNCQEQEQP